MSPTELERPLEARALREIERALYGKLKAHRLSDSFIERCAEEAVQIGVVEYLRALREGVEVKDRGGFVVRAAFCRAIDELRREARQADGAAVEAMLESGHLAAPATDEIAIESLAAEELREAIDTLAPEERQALSLHYFEELSDQRSAEILYCSERTFRRRLAKAMGNLGRRLGAPAPEPGSGLAIEVGLVAWVSLRGARVAISHGPFEQLAGLIDGARNAGRWPIERLRDLATSITASGASEKIGALASGPAGKFAGGCLGAAALCVLGGVAIPGVGGVGHTGNPQHARLDAKPPAARIAAPQAPAPAEADSPTAAARRNRPTAPRANRRSAVRQRRVARRAERRQVEAQTSGIVRAASESPPPPSGTTASSAAAPEAEAVTVAPTTSSSAPRSSSEEAQAETQFGAFK